MTLRELLRKNPTIKIAVRLTRSGTREIYHTDTCDGKILDKIVEQVRDGVAYLK